MPIIIVGNEKGGVGKTAISTNFAAIATAEGIETLLLDTDPQGSSASWITLRKNNEVEPAVQLLTLPANPLAELTKLATKYQLIIVDIGAQNYKTLLECAVIADLVLVPTDPDQLSVESTLRVLGALKTVGRKHRLGYVPTRVVLNMQSTNNKSIEEQTLRDFLNEENVPVMQSSLKQRTSMRNARRGGLAVHELMGKDKDRKAAEEMHALFDESEAVVLGEAA